MTREGCRYLVNEGYQAPLRVVSVKTRYWNGGYERGAEVGICHNRRDVGLTLACNNQPGAGHDDLLSSILLIVRWKTYVIGSNLNERSCVAAKYISVILIKVKGYYMLEFRVIERGGYIPAVEKIRPSYGQMAGMIIHLLQCFILLSLMSMVKMRYRKC
jgi:hypothetical protein